MDPKIINFINEHHVLTLATSINDQAYVANCFFVYLSKENAFIFTSSPETRHGSEMLINKRVAANIVLETKTVGKIQGLQMMANIEKLEGVEERNMKIAYLKKYPFAVLKLETMWKLTPDFMKLTDNSLGFGKKLIWRKED